MPSGPRAKRERQYEKIRQSARDRGVEGRSKMNKDELSKALGR